MKRIPEYSVRLHRTGSLVHEANHHQDAIKIARAFLSPDELAREVFAVLTLDIKLRITGCVRISEGSIDACLVEVRDVAQAALLANASAVILVHNHPSGRPDPSPEDVSATRKIADALRLFRVNVLDHLILGNSHEHVPDVSLKGLGHQW